MIKNLTKENDKINMIPVIQLINKRIRIFFENNKSNNMININGAWGSGKSTIINNLENFYENNENTKWIIVNLWEYETSTEPYFDLINDIANKIISFTRITETEKEEQITKIRKLSFSFKIKYNDWEFTPGVDYETRNKIVKKQLKEIIQELILELNSFVGKNKIVVIFDELDRCTPNNQIKFLSYINNIFLKITSVFYLVASNNEIINSNINNILIEKDDYFNEKYTDKIFNVTLNLKDVFFSENMDFTKNTYIQEFIKKVKLINPRLLNKILFQTNSIFNNIKQFELFSFLENNEKIEWKKTAIERLEFIIFYIKYIKYKNYSSYSDILKFSNTASIEWKKLLENFKNITKNWPEIIKRSNTEIIEFLLKNKEIFFRNPDWPKTSQAERKTIYFCIENNNLIIPIWFSALIPFLGSYIKNNNLNDIFSFKSRFSNEEALSTLLYEIKNHNYEHANQIFHMADITLITLQIEKLNIPNYLKEFINILLKDFDSKNYILEEFKITFDVIKILIEESIFDY